MAFTSYGKGNWAGLPEFGITELFGGNKKSTSDATYRTATGNSTVNMSVNPTKNAQQLTAIKNYATPKTLSASGQSSAGDILGSSSSRYSDISNSGDQQAIDDQIQNAYGDTVNYLNGQKQSLYNQQNDFYNAYTQPYDAQVPLINQAGQEGTNTLNANIQDIRYNEQNALTAARNLYNELTQRNRQAFGGSALSSTGQAAGEILGRSAMQQFGNVRNSANQGVADVQGQIANLQQKVQSQLQSIEYQKQAALSQAKLDFMDKIREIDNAIGAAGDAKNSAKLNELQKLQARVWNIQDQARQYAAQSQNTAQSILDSLLNDKNAAMTAGASSLNGAANTMGAAPTNITSANQLNGGYSYTPTSYMAGRIKTGNNEYDYTNPIASAQSMYNSYNA